MKIEAELIPISEGKQIVIKQTEKLTVGRDSSLGCDDKKISRQHAELFFKDDSALIIKPTHKNPVFYRPLNGKTIQLTKDVEQILNEGDQFGLLPTTFFFRIHFNAIVDESKSISQETDFNDSTQRKLPTWMVENTSKRPASPEPKESSVVETFDAEAKQSLDLNSSPVKKKKLRTKCPFGSSCYRKNPIHRTEESHPGDSDYEDEKSTKTNDKPVCPYGKTCYRQNLQHKLEYQH